MVHDVCATVTGADAGVDLLYPLRVGPVRIVDIVAAIAATENGDGAVGNECDAVEALR